MTVKHRITVSDHVEAALKAICACSHQETNALLQRLVLEGMNYLWPSIAHLWRLHAYEKITDEEYAAALDDFVDNFGTNPEIPF